MSAKQNNGRRNALKLGFGAAAISTISAAGQAQAATVKSPFVVAQTYVPIAGSSEEIGRAHV